jgi:hypothetical protein
MYFYNPPGITPSHNSPRARLCARRRSQSQGSLSFSLGACMCVLDRELFRSFSTLFSVHGHGQRVTKSAWRNECARRVYIAAEKLAAKSGGLLENWPQGVRRWRRRRIWHFVCANLLGVCTSCMFVPVLLSCGHLQPLCGHANFIGLAKLLLVLNGKLGPSLHQRSLAGGVHREWI